MGWFVVQHDGAACTVVHLYMSIRLRETVSEFYVSREIQRRGPNTTVYTFIDLSIQSLFNLYSLSACFECFPLIYLIFQFGLHLPKQPQ